MQVYVICPVRAVTTLQVQEIEKQVRLLEGMGFTVYWPPRNNQYEDTDPTGMAICNANLHAIRAADIVAIWYDWTSTGSHFDLGMAYALQKPLLWLNASGNTTGKAFYNFIRAWSGLDDRDQ